MLDDPDHEPPSCARNKNPVNNLYCQPRGQAESVITAASLSVESLDNWAWVATDPPMMRVEAYQFERRDMHRGLLVPVFVVEGCTLSDRFRDARPAPVAGMTVVFGKEVLVTWFGRTIGHASFGATAVAWQH